MHLSTMCQTCSVLYIQYYIDLHFLDKPNNITTLEISGIIYRIVII